jgi:hypothetical protein
MSGASNAPVAKIQRGPTPVRRDTSAAFVDRYVAVYPSSVGRTMWLWRAGYIAIIDPGRPVFVGIACLPLGRAGGLNL